MDTISLAIVIATYLLVGFFGSLVGGGALLTIPVLIFTGLSPHAAIATNKIGSLGLGSGGSAGYTKEKQLDYKFGLIFMLFVGIGSLFGSYYILKIPEEFIKKIIGIMMILITLILLFDKKIAIKKATGKNKTFAIASYGIASGFYHGFYGAGIGIINRLVLSAFFAFSVIGSAAISVFANMASSIISLVMFTYYGVVEYSLFIPIFTSSAIGAYAGSTYGSRLGNEKIKILLLISAFAMAIKLLFF